MATRETVSQRRTASSSSPSSDDVDGNSAKSSPMSPGTDGKRSNPDVLLNNRSEWLMVQSRLLRIYKRKFVVVSRASIDAFETETDLTKPVYTLPCVDILEAAPSPEDPTVVVVKLRGDVLYRFKFAMADRAKDWCAAVGARALKKSK